MLHELRVQNFILIDNICLKFSSGLNTLTGETGTGKSVILHSIDCLVKNRLSPDLIKAGKQEAYLEGIIATNPEINNWLIKHDISQDNNTMGLLLK